MSPLQTTALFLGATLIMVPLLKRFGLASVIGYLATGILLGPHGAGLISDAHDVLSFAEYGVVLLLFLIGIELEPSRLWVLRRSVFGLGGLQVVSTGLVFMGITRALGYSLPVSFVVGFGLALSSTAFVLQLLSEKKQLTTQHGRKAFSILLFQDLAVIPLLAMIPWLGGKSAHYGWIDLGKLVLVAGIFIVSSRTLIRPALRFVASAGTPEVFTAAALFLVCGAGVLTESLGISMSLGAFAAGILLADSEYRHEIEASLQPIKALLLGLFFIAVGMTADIDLLRTEAGLIIGAVLGLMLIKFFLLVFIGRITGTSLHGSVQLGVPLAQGGEFAFVLFSAAAAESIFPADMANRLILIVTVSMALTPFAFMLLEHVLEPWLRPKETRVFDEIPEHDNPVVIAGFGRFGQIVARVLRMHRIGFTALEADVRQVDFVRRFGNQVYYGNPANMDFLRAAGVGKAKIFVLAMDDVQDSVKTAEAMHRLYPKVAIYARARDRAHAYQLMDIGGVTVINRETYLSSLDLAQKVLTGLGMDAERAARDIATFKDYDEKLIVRQHAIYQDEAKLIESAKESMQELEELFESDARAAAKQSEISTGEALENGKA